MSGTNWLACVSIRKIDLGMRSKLKSTHVHARLETRSGHGRYIWFGTFFSTLETVYPSWIRKSR